MVNDIEIPGLSLCFRSILLAAAKNIVHKLFHERSPLFSLSAPQFHAITSPTRRVEQLWADISHWFDTAATGCDPFSIGPGVTNNSLPGIYWSWSHRQFTARRTLVLKSPTISKCQEDVEKLNGEGEVIKTGSLTPPSLVPSQLLPRTLELGRVISLDPNPMLFVHYSYKIQHTKHFSQSQPRILSRTLSHKLLLKISLNLTSHQSYQSAINSQPLTCQPSTGQSFTVNQLLVNHSDVNHSLVYHRAPQHSSAVARRRLILTYQLFCKHADGSLGQSVD
jgi:hypothetical protein